MSDPPRLRAGSRLGPYEIVALLGAGGMGEVYRARDPRLGRDVAIKVLLPDLSLEPSQLSRFEQEARAAGALNHPNLLAVFDTGQHDGTVYIVFELLQGKTLRERLRSGPLAPAEAIELAAEVAQGLAAAHERGIVHRDLKPDNIFVTRNGRVKILDFGLAKLHRAVADEPRGSQADTASALTGPGAVLGTVAYMSPEQVKGGPVDARSDIFSLGTLLYELLSSQRAFQRATPAETVAAILNEEPPALTQPNATVPAALERVVRRCLEKRPEDRFHSAHDLALALEVAATATAPAAPSDRVSRSRRPAWRHVAVGLALAALVAAAATWLVRGAAFRGAEPAGSASRFALMLPEGTTAPDLSGGVAISRDGTTVAVTAQRGGVSALYVRKLDRWDWTRIPSTESASTPFFSPNGEWLGFFVPGKLQRVALAGGAPQFVCPAVNGNSGSWGEDGQILLSFGFQPGIWRVSATGGKPQRLTGEDESSGSRYGSAHLLPGRRAILFGTWTAGRSAVEVMPLDGGARRRLVDGSYPQYAKTGHLVYLSGNQLMAVPFDLQSLGVRGASRSVVEDVRRSRNVILGDFALSETGTLVYVPDTKPQTRLVLADRTGKRSALPLPSRTYMYPALSPEGGRVAVTIADDTGRDLWVGDLARGALSRLTTDGDAVFSLWSPDGTEVIYTSSRAGQYNLFRKRVDDDREPERLVESAHPQSATSWSPDGRVLLLNDIDPVTRIDIWVLPLDGDVKPRPLIKTPARELRGMFSPDGRWIAYASDESGRDEVYVQAYPGLGHKRQISTDGGMPAAWVSGGRELFYVNGDQLLSVAIEPGDDLRVGAPRVLFQGALVEESRRAGPYEVTRDGKRFLLVEDLADKAASTRLHVVRDWFDELTRRVPVR
jgi:Tol biopolymer transport system component